MYIGGVPEHFNLPWRLAIEEGFFSSRGISLDWIDYPGGTGAMNKALREGEIDLATILTEGIVADICNGNPSQLLKIHVQTPLNWGIFVNQNSDFQLVDDLKTARFAISRMGSGSHLMAYVNALQLNWKPADLSMVILNNLEGMRRGLRDNEADAFMWEKVMTQPYVDSGELRRVGICPTPWPGFVLAARTEVIENQPETLRKSVMGSMSLSVLLKPGPIWILLLQNAMACHWRLCNNGLQKLSGPPTTLFMRQCWKMYCKRCNKLVHFRKHCLSRI